MTRKTRWMVVLAWLVMASGAGMARGAETSLADDAELVEARHAVPRLKAAAAFEVQGDTLKLELSEYAGYAGLVVANGGLEPSENSYFFKSHGFKVQITISEEDSWSSLNSGRIGASATTADVLPLYGAQLQAVVPALIGFSRGADGIVVKSPIQKINDLRGKTLAVAQFNESDFFLRYLTQQAGLEVYLRPDFATPADPRKVNVVACADSFGAGDLFLRDLKSGRGRLDGCVTWDPKTSEVVEGSGGKARLLTSNRNLLIVADVLLVNKGFAEQHPEMVNGLVDGLLEGNRMVRENPDSHLAVIAKAFGWEPGEVRGELQKVHLANLPENLAFFEGSIDSAGSYGYIYESATAAYGAEFVRGSFNGDKFISRAALKAADAGGRFKSQKADIRPIRSNEAVAVEQPLLSRDVRFLFQPNSSKLNMEDPKNTSDLDFIAKMLKVSPGSTLLLRGHVDDAMIGVFQKQGGPEFVQKMAMKAVQLSKDRCEEVKGKLVQQFGVDESRVDYVGCGWREPLGKDIDQNRRVEVQWFMVE
ncbi:MAG: OmpA family protein [Lentisphaerae bacterium]|nr:OmpA family protein [Lentisphaerota bacterium]